MATGSTSIDFGAFPGDTNASVAIADATVGGTSKTEAWLVPVATADHTADEHLVAPLRIMAGPPTAGVGFTVHGVSTWDGMLYGLWSIEWASAA